MSKMSRKLSLKKETLRSLDARQLEQVNGGLAYEWVILKQPSKGSIGCTGDLAYFNFDYYYFY